MSSGAPGKALKAHNKNRKALKAHNKNREGGSISYISKRMGQVKGSISNAPGLLGGPIRTTWDGLLKMLAPGMIFLLSWEVLAGMLVDRE